MVGKAKIAMYWTENMGELGIVVNGKLIGKRNIKDLNEDQLYPTFCLDKG